MLGIISIDFWFDRCLEDVGSPINHVVAAGAIGLTRITLANMVDYNGDGEWRWSEFDQLLPMDILLHITATKGPMMAYSGNIIGWKLNANHPFTIRSAYVSLVPLEDGLSLC
ncbi:hypothetical protein V6N13_089589 [Hibiscus sabdariffa]|uniref:Uncharacterized protein n=1 Tax=Hibiscus sabdariffa TaxID=183260 RepID=A0ABR2QJC6_9ROSI